MAGRPVVALVGFAAGAETEIHDYLDRRGYETLVAAESWAAETLLSGKGADVAVVDLAMPRGAALDLLRRHAGGALFVMRGADGDIVERVLALELGAADVVDRTIHPRELAARIAGLVSRRGKGTADLAMLENATVDLKASLVMHRSGREDTLSPGQTALLKLLIGNPGRVLSRDDIIAAAPAEATDAFDRSIDSRIVRLRRKLDTECIVTIRGSGYRFDPPGKT